MDSLEQLLERDFTDISAAARMRLAEPSNHATVMVGAFMPDGRPNAAQFVDAATGAAVQVERALGF